MSKYTITEVSTMLNIKVHIIRYWEKTVGLFSIRRDQSGKRVYESQDILMLAQFDFLVSKKKYSIKKAEEALIALFNSPWYASRRDAYFPFLKNLESQRTLLSQAQQMLSALKSGDS